MTRNASLLKIIFFQMRYDLYNPQQIVYRNYQKENCMFLHFIVAYSQDFKIFAEARQS